MTVQYEKGTILIVDDIPENLSSLEKILRKLGVEVIKAESGNEALTATLYHEFSLIILDIQMPGMNGLEVAEMLKQDDRTADIPIIFVSAMDKDESFELKAYSKGAVDFLYKPFNTYVLLSKVQVLLDLYIMKKNLDQVMLRHKTEKPKILAVDDNPENILVLKKLLNKLDVTVISANSGNEALAETLYNDFAIVFLDVQMPGMDGYEVAELLKSEEKTAGIPIIFITAIDRDDAKEIKGYGKGAVDFIFKPFNEFILHNKTKIFLEIYNLRTGLEALVAERTSALEESNRRLINEIKRKEIAEKELRKTRSYLNSVFNSMSSVLIGTDDKGIIIDMNLNAETISGVSIKKAKGCPVDEVFPFFSTIISELLELVSSNEPVMMTKVAVKMEGTVRFNDFAVYPLVGGNIDQFVIMVDDRTEAKQMEEELQERRHIDSLGQLAGGIAHDFNNMLGAIMGGADLLRVKAGDDRDLMRPIASILQSVDRAADLTAKLLSFARKKGSKKTTIDLHQLINDTVIILQRSIDKRISIVVKTNADRSMVEGDDSELSNALLNLGINARDAMPEGGVLTISTCNRDINDKHRASTLELPEGRYVELCVSDSGTGMTDEVQTKVFEPFFTTKEPGKGTGLGLASVYGTVKAHCGAILLESTFGKGSSFTALLPTSEKVAIASSSPSEEIVTEGGLEGTVLLVEDEDNVRAVGEELLSELGLEVITAENGRQAIDIVAERKDEITLIILDMIMPELNGHDCYLEIKKIFPEAKVVICSGYAPEEMVSKLRLEGILGFIQKPFRFSELKKVLYSCLSNAKPE